MDIRSEATSDILGERLQKSCNTFDEAFKFSSERLETWENITVHCSKNLLEFSLEESDDLSILD